MLARMDAERQTLNKAIQRAEALTHFFNEKVPYQSILEDLQDKKYRDARQMLAKGLKSEQIAKELGLSKAEMEIITGVF
jgi:DNA-binding NarL/FixJ family response regulator